MKDFDDVFCVALCSAAWLNLDSTFPQTLALENGPFQRRAKRLSVEIACLKVRWHVADPCRLVLTALTCIQEIRELSLSGCYSAFAA